MKNKILRLSTAHCIWQTLNACSLVIQLLSPTSSLWIFICSLRLAYWLFTFLVVGAVTHVACLRLIPPCSPTAPHITSHVPNTPPSIHFLQNSVRSCWAFSFAEDATRHRTVKTCCPHSSLSQLQWGAPPLLTLVILCYDTAVSDLTSLSVTTPTTPIYADAALLTLLLVTQSSDASSLLR